jgi:hypothetical protein
MGLCFNYNEPFTHGHKCKHLFDIMLVNDYNFDDTDASLMMMIGAQNLGVLGWCTMFLVGAILGQGVRILIDIGATYNVVDINFARLVGILERHIDATILIGSDTKISY